MRDWKKWGVAAGLGNLAAGLILAQIDRLRAIDGTVWASIYRGVNFLPSLAARVFLNAMSVPRVYDVPLSLYEQSVLLMTELVTGFVWGFFTGAIAAVIVYRLRRAKPGTGTI